GGRARGGGAGRARPPPPVAAHDLIDQLRGLAQRVVASVQEFDLGAEHVRRALCLAAPDALDLRKLLAVPPCPRGLTPLTEARAEPGPRRAAGGGQRHRTARPPDEVARMRADHQDRPVLRHHVPQTSCAVSTTSLSLSHCCCWLRSLPSLVEEKPHCGDRHSWSMSTNRAASSIRRLSWSLLSSSPRFVVTSPSTTRLPLGTKRSGSKSPDRSSSHSQKNPSTRSSLNSASATNSEPPWAAHMLWLSPRHVGVVTARWGGGPDSARLMFWMSRSCWCWGSPPMSATCWRWAGSFRYARLVSSSWR